MAEYYLEPSFAKGNNTKGKPINIEPKKEIEVDAITAQGKLDFIRNNKIIIIAIAIIILLVIVLISVYLFRRKKTDNKAPDSPQQSQRPLKQPGKKTTATEKVDNTTHNKIASNNADIDNNTNKSNQTNDEEPETMETISVVVYETDAIKPADTSNRVEELDHDQVVETADDAEIKRYIDVNKPTDKSIKLENEIEDIDE